MNLDLKKKVGLFFTLGLLTVQQNNSAQSLSLQSNTQTNWQAKITLQNLLKLGQFLHKSMTATTCKTNIYPTFSEEPKRAPVLFSNNIMRIQHCGAGQTYEYLCPSFLQLGQLPKNALIHKLFVDTQFWREVRQIEQNYAAFDKSANKAGYYFSNSLMLQRSNLVTQALNENRTVRTVFIGDSLMHLFENSSAPQQFPDGIFLGISGDRTDSLLFRIMDHVGRIKPDNVVISISGNDVLQSCEPVDRVNNRRLIVEALKSIGVKRILWMALPPLADKTKAPIAKAENGVIAQIPQIEFVDSYTPMLGADGKINPVYSGDGTHFNNLGYEQVWIPLLKQRGI